MNRNETALGTGTRDKAPRRSLSRSTATLAWAILVGAALSAGPVDGSHASVIIETWEAGFVFWDVVGPGAAQDCAEGNPGCSLRLAPPCCGQWAVLSRALAVPVLSATEVVTDFKGSSLSGDTNTKMRITFSSDAQIVMTFTDFRNPNNGMSIQSPVDEHRDFARWTSTTAWHQVAIVIDPVTDTTRGELRTEDGAVVATSQTIEIGGSADQITQIAVGAGTSPGSSVVFHYDNLRIGVLH